MSLHTQDFEYVRTTNNDSKGVETYSRGGASLLGNGHSHQGKRLSEYKINNCT